MKLNIDKHLNLVDTDDITSVLIAKQADQGITVHSSTSVTQTDWLVELF